MIRSPLTVYKITKNRKHIYTQSLCNMKSAEVNCACKQQCIYAVENILKELTFLPHFGEQEPK